MRQTNSTIPVVYVSGDSASQWGAEGVPNSIMISKPFFLPQVITAISTLLNQTDPTYQIDEKVSKIPVFDSDLCRV